MGRIAAYVAWRIEGLLMRARLIGQDLISYRELKAMFGGDYPSDVWRVIEHIDGSTTRETLLAALRDVANRNARGAIAASSEAEIPIDRVRKDDAGNYPLRC